MLKERERGKEKSQWEKVNKNQTDGIAFFLCDFGH